MLNPKEPKQCSNAPPDEQRLIQFVPDQGQEYVRLTNIRLAKFLLTLLPPWLKPRLISLFDNIFDIYAIKSYSQEGEDMILRRMFERQQRGFYVDVGAHHPRRFSVYPAN